MAKKSKPSAVRKPKGGGKRPLRLLLAILILIVLVFLGLEALRTKAPPPPEQPPPAVVHRQIPPRPQPQEYGQQSSATAPQPPPAVHPARPAQKKPSAHGSLAIIIDDMGTSTREARDLLAIGLPVTFAVIPGLPKDRSVAELAYQQGAKVMLHLPMEPQGYPRQRLEKNGLLLSQPDSELTERVRGYLQAVPHAVGANNHMGSLFTEDAGKMKTVLGVLQEQGLFFIDSRTTPKSVALQQARQLGMETGTRNVFLDNVQEVGAIKAQLDEAARMARKNGSAIAIGHPHPTTIQALREKMPVLKEQGITFVFASELVR